MQEIWLFGKLDLVSQDEEETEQTHLVDLAAELMAVASKKRHGQITTSKS
jgi:hypothetical protein